MSSPRNVGIEWLRGVSIVCVVSLHCLRPYFVAEKAPIAFEDGLRVLLDLATPAFFFVSGFLLPRRPDGSKLRKRLLRIFLPYVVASLFKFLVDFWSSRARSDFWKELLLELSMTHLGPEPFAENCVLQDKLRPFGNFFGYDREPEKASELARRVVAGSAFGHYYFVTVLLQLQILAHCFMQPRSDLFLRRLVIFLAIWHPLRGLVVDDVLNLPGYLSWRAPFMWCFYFVFGFYVKHTLLLKHTDDQVLVQPPLIPVSSSSSGDHPTKKRTDDLLRQRATLFACIACLAAILGASTAAYAARPTTPYPSACRRVAKIFKDIYVVALPAAVCLFGAIQTTPQQQSRFRLFLLLRRRLAAELSRLSYTIYLYHGFFLNLPYYHPWDVLAASLALAYLIELIAKPHVANAFFGISPPPTYNTPDDDKNHHPPSLSSQK